MRLRKECDLGTGVWEGRWDEGVGGIEKKKRPFPDVGNNKKQEKWDLQKKMQTIDTQTRKQHVNKFNLKKSGVRMLTKDKMKIHKKREANKSRALEYDNKKQHSKAVRTNGKKDGVGNKKTKKEKRQEVENEGGGRQLEYENNNKYNGNIKHTQQKREYDKGGRTKKRWPGGRAQGGKGERKDKDHKKQQEDKNKKAPKVERELVNNNKN